MVAPVGPATSAPTCFLHKATGQAVVKLGGRFVYLGAWDAPDRDERYRRVVAEWQARGRVAATAGQALRVADLVAGYWQHAETYYRKDGKPTSELGAIKQAMRFAVKLYGTTTATEFGPLALKACRQAMIEAELSRTTINGYVSRVRQCFRWAVENQWVTPSVLEGLRAVPGLKRGRTPAKESEPVRPVDENDMRAVQPLVSREVAAMIELQWLTGMRPNEVVAMRMAELDRGGRVWLYRPRHHKNEHYGCERVIPLGPKAQEVVLPFLQLDPEAFLFSPKAAEAARNAVRRAGRRTKRWRSHDPEVRRRRRGSVPQPRDAFGVDTYRRAIDRACRSAGIEPWSPNQLRHSAATRIRKEMGLEAAQAVLGHRLLETTQVYAEVSRQRAVEVMERLG
jgi:integrase